MRSGSGRSSGVEPSRNFEDGQVRLTKLSIFEVHPLTAPPGRFSVSH